MYLFWQVKVKTPVWHNYTHGKAFNLKATLIIWPRKIGLTEKQELKTLNIHVSKCKYDGEHVTHVVLCLLYTLNNSFKKTAKCLNALEKTNHQWTAQFKVLHQGIIAILPGCHQMQKWHCDGSGSLGSVRHCGDGIKLSWMYLHGNFKLK